MAMFQNIAISLTNQRKFCIIDSKNKGKRIKILKLENNYIDSLAPANSTITSAKGLVKKNSFTNLNISQDKTVIFGTCAGSGKTPYFCSMDFINEASPVPRCNCPSRQIPCKHVMGLMYAYSSGINFAEADIPEDIISKREKAQKREEKKEEKKEKIKTDKPKPLTKTKIQSTIKRIDVQLEGIEIAKKLLTNILQNGLASIDASTHETLKTQVTNLGNYHIKGIQDTFIDLFIYLKNDNDSYTKSIEQINFIYVLLNKAVLHFNSKKEDEQNITKLETATNIEEQIGHIWKLEELYANNLYIKDSQIVQLSFNIIDNKDKKDYNDIGIYICLDNGQIYKKINHRSYRAKKYIKEDDTIFGTLTLPEIYIYPGDINKRIRFDGYKLEQEIDYKKIKSYASTDYKTVTKEIKNQLKNPLADKNPIMLLSIFDIFATEQGYTIIKDENGEQQLLQGDTLDFLNKFPFEKMKGQAITVCYTNDITTGILTAKPLSIVTDDRIIRLEY